VKRRRVRLPASVDRPSSIVASPTWWAAHAPARLLHVASDDRLVELVRGGSEPAFEVVFDRHHRGVLALCRHMLGSPQEAEDAVQHTFLAAYRDLAGSRKTIRLRPWLYTIARHRCLSLLRARREKPVEELESLSTEHLSAAVQRRQDLRDLLFDVSGLPHDQRAALVLAEVGDVSHEEIAQVLGVRREKVKALVYQARSSLIASREARETPCGEIRTQLAQLRGGALRRTTLRRHLRDCPGCRAFRAALQKQRRMLALALPVAPSLALKGGALAATLGTGGAVVGGSAGTALTAKVLVVATVAGGGAAGVRAATSHHRPAPQPPRVVRAIEPPARTAAPAVVTAEQQEAAPVVPARLRRATPRSAPRTRKPPHKPAAPVAERAVPAPPPPAAVHPPAPPAPHEAPPAPAPQVPAEAPTPEPLSTPQPPVPVPVPEPEPELAPPPPPAAPTAPASPGEQTGDAPTLDATADQGSTDDSTAGEGQPHRPAEQGDGGGNHGGDGG
jgi:RNA polymerase sigma factor (sigma-70 family)